MAEGLLPQSTTNRALQPPMSVVPKVPLVFKHLSSNMGPTKATPKKNIDDLARHKWCYGAGEPFICHPQIPSFTGQSKCEANKSRSSADDPKFYPGLKNKG